MNCFTLVFTLQRYEGFDKQIYRIFVRVNRVRFFQQVFQRDWEEFDITQRAQRMTQRSQRISFWLLKKCMIVEMINYWLTIFLKMNILKHDYQPIWSIILFCLLIKIGSLIRYPCMGENESPSLWLFLLSGSESDSPHPLPWVWLNIPSRIWSIPYNSPTEIPYSRAAS